MQLVGWADHSFLNVTHNQSRERERAERYSISTLAIVFYCVSPLTGRVMT